MAAATASRTWPALGSSERCSIDANKASAQTALVLGRYISSCILSPLTGLPPALMTLEKAVGCVVRLTEELHRPGYALWCTPGDWYTGSAAAAGPANLQGARRQAGRAGC